MDNYPIPANPVYNEEIRALQNTDPASATDTFNPLIARLIENTAAVKKQASTKQDAFTGEGRADQYARGDGTWQNLNHAVRITRISPEFDHLVVAGQEISNNDNLMEAIGKIEGRLRAGVGGGVRPPSRTIGIIGQVPAGEADFLIAADDNAALQQVLNSTAAEGIELLLNGGTYLISTPMWMPSNLKIRASRGATLKGVPVPGAEIWEDGGFFNVDDNVTIDGFTFTGIWRDGPSAMFIGGDDVSIQNCWFTSDDFTPFMASSVRRLFIFNNRFVGNSRFPSISGTGIAAFNYGVSSWPLEDIGNVPIF